MKLAEWDIAAGYRRFWWLLPPMAMAAVIFAAIRIGSAFFGGPVVMQLETNRNLTTGPAPRVVVENWAGDIRIAGAKDHFVLITVRREGKGDSKEAAYDDLAGIQVQIVQEGDTVTIRATRDVPGGRSRLGHATIELQVPAAAKLEVSTGEGDIFAGNATGNIDALTADGDITLLLPKGEQFELQATGTLHPKMKLQFADGAQGVTLARTPDAADGATQLNLRASRGNVRLLENE